MFCSSGFRSGYERLLVLKCLNGDSVHKLTYERETRRDVQTHWLRLNIGISCLGISCNRKQDIILFDLDHWTLLLLYIPCVCRFIGKECSVTDQWIVKSYHWDNFYKPMRIRFTRDDLPFFTVETSVQILHAFAIFNTLPQVIWLDLHRFISQSYSCNSWMIFFLVFTDSILRIVWQKTRADRMRELIAVQGWKCSLSINLQNQ